MLFLYYMYIHGGNMVGMQLSILSTWYRFTKKKKGGGMNKNMTLQLFQNVWQAK